MNAKRLLGERALLNWTAHSFDKCVCEFDERRSDKA